MLRGAHERTEAIQPQMDIQGSSQTTNLRSLSDQTNTDTIESLESGCCGHPIAFMSGCLSWISTILNGIKEWIFSCFCPVGVSEANDVLKSDPRIFFENSERNMYDKLQGFYQILRELTETLSDDACNYRPVGMSDETMKAAVIAAYRDLLPETIKNALEYEFGQAQSLYKVSSFPREQPNFVTCLEQNPDQAKAIVLDLIHCQASFYMEPREGVQMGSSPLKNAKVLREMLQLCEITSQANIMESEAFCESFLMNFVYLDHESKEKLAPGFASESITGLETLLKDNSVAFGVFLNVLKLNIRLLIP